mgnify:CR=1 FL=1
MRSQTAAMTRKGQVTVPKEFRKKLGATLPDRVEFAENEAGEIVIRPVRLTVDDLFGIFPPIPGREDADVDELVREAMDDMADRIVEDLSRQ